MQFTTTGFSCEVAVFRNGPDLVARFYAQAREHRPEQMQNLVVADPGFGYLCLKFVGPDALLTGFLDESVFTTDALVQQAIDWLEQLEPAAARAYLPHHVRRFRATGYVEYNGEY